MFLLSLSFSQAPPAFAADTSFTANIALTSDYVFRGISQSNEEPTIQGGMDWADPITGIYAGVWASGVDFDDATTEMDFYGGISKTDGKCTWDIGAIYYSYPGADNSKNYDFWELATAVSYDFDTVQATASLNYSPDYFGASGDAWYPAVNVTIPLPHNFTADANYGHQWISNNSAFGTADYSTWSLGLGYEIEGFNLSLKYIDTDLEEPINCVDGCSQRAVFTVSRSF